ncbi:MFS transporter [Virgisporangium ochraceum]|uniref:MFS transporter n=1 Tax=Virgisporangium ochraceum TaxID=65505 RepID=UPI0019426215|nr:MFS transporter [Virgisporangium ochraceum]
MRLPQFRLLFAGLVVSMVGDSAMMLVPAILMRDLTGSAGAAGLTIMFFMLPICAAPAFGWVIDRFRRRTVLVVTCLLSAVALVPLFTVDGRGDWWTVYAVSATMGASYVCVFGSVTALVRDLVPHEHLAGANSAIQTVRQGLRLGGPLLGAALYTVAGIGPVALVNLVSFLAAALVFRLLRVRESPPPRSRFALWTEVTAGMRVIAGTAPVRRSVVAICALFVAGGLTESAIFAVVTEGLGRPPAFVGVLATVTGVGAVLGGLAASRVIARYGELAAVGVGAAVYALATIGMSVPALPAVTAAAAATGVGLTIPFIARVTLLQKTAPAHLIGRATTAYDAVGGVSQVVSIAAGAALVSVVSYRLLLPAFGVLVLLAAAYAWRGAGMTRPAAGYARTGAARA